MKVAGSMTWDSVQGETWSGMKGLFMREKGKNVLIVGRRSSATIT
jgi:hypothetical protein